MRWDDIGYLLSKNKYNENSLIVEIFTENHGKVAGIIFGGTSKKQKNYLQIGNKLFVNYSFKNENKLGYFKFEIIEAFSPLYFDNNQKLCCIGSAMSLLKILNAENQFNHNIFTLINVFFLNLNDKDWIKKYIFWELELFKLLGYDLKLENYVTKEVIDKKNFYFVKSSSNKKEIPNFLIEKNNDTVEISNLLKGFKLVGDFLDKTILKPNNINYPLHRDQFFNTLK